MPSTKLSSLALIPLMNSLVAAQTPPGFTPSTSALLPASFRDISVTPGQHLSVNATASQPTIAFPVSSLVIMLDLDTPYASQNRSLSPFVHWIGTSSNQSVIQYGGPEPPAGSPDHRYVLLSYTLPANATGTLVVPTGFEEVGSTIASRANFDLAGFVQKSNLLGPTEANWFVVSAAGNKTGVEPFEGSAMRPTGIARNVVLASALTLGLVAWSVVQ